MSAKLATRNASSPAGPTAPPSSAAATAPTPQAPAASASHASNAGAADRERRRSRKVHRRHRCRDGTSYRSGAASDPSQPPSAGGGRAGASSRSPVRADASGDESSVVRALRERVAQLESLVERLNVELARCQGTSLQPLQGAARAHSPGAESGFVAPPWWTAVEALSPLAVAYDARVAALEAEVAARSTAAEAAQQRVIELATENDGLHVELARALEALVARAEAGGGAAGVSAAGEEWEDLNEQLALLREENALLMKQQTALGHEVDTLRGEAAAGASALAAAAEEATTARSEANAIQEAAAAVQATALAQAEALAQARALATARVADAEAARDETRRMADELAAQQRSTDDFRRVIDELSAQVQRAVGEAASACERENEAAFARRLAEEAAVDARAEAARARREAQRSEAARCEVESLIASLETRLAVAEREAEASLVRARVAVDALEELRLERDQAVLREELAGNSLAAMGAELRDALAAREEAARAGRAAAAAEAAESISRLSAENESLAARASEAQLLAERALRERRVLETELERLAASTDGRRLRAQYEDAEARARAAERARDDIAQRADASFTAQRLAEAEWARERAALETQLTDAGRRVRRLEGESLASQQERLAALREAARLQRAYDALVESREALERRAAAEASRVTAEAAARESDLAVRLEAAEAALARALDESESLLAAQRDLTAKWRVASQHTQADAEAALGAANAENSMLQARVDELSARVAQLLQARSEAMKQQATDREIAAQLRALLASAEARASGAATMRDITNAAAK